MDNEKDLLDFNLDDLMKEFQNIGVKEDSAVSGDTAEISAVFSSLAQEPAEAPAEEGVFSLLEQTADPASPEEAVQPEVAVQPEEPIYEEPNAPDGVQDDSILPEETILFDAVPGAEISEEPTVTLHFDAAAFSEQPEEVSEEPTTRVEAAAEKDPAAQPEQPAKQEQAPKGTDPGTASRSAKIRELKRKLVAGPERKYYSLNELGVGKLQLGILFGCILLLLCVIEVVMFATGKFPANRTKFLIFTQVLAMLVSGLLGSHIMLDGLGDLFRLRYSVNSTLAISFLACCADAWFCLEEKRIPCCSAFVLEMTVATIARYQKRSTEMSQLDTLRKASRLNSIVKEPNFYEKRAGILRGQGDVEDFMDTYSRPSGPEIIQRVFAFIALICSIGIAVLAGLLHGVSMGVQIFSTALLVSVPASYFITLTRPAALLEKRLHMVGSLICGWQGVKKLCGRAVFPVRDRDLFPRGSTKLNGIKFYSDRTPAEVVSYTASLIFAAGGGLVPLFRNLLVSRSGTEYPVHNFRDYGVGGIGGEVNGEPVLLGTQDFLQDMGVEIPKGTMVNQAIYVSIDGQLSAVIAISYAKMRSAAAGLVSLSGSWKLKPVLLAGDFMLTDSFIYNKFSIRGRKMILPTKDVRAELAAKTPDPEADVLALTTRDELVSAVYPVTGAMALRNAYRVGTFINILGGLCGIAIMVALAYLGYNELLVPVNVLLYQVIWMIPSFLASEWTRTV